MLREENKFPEQTRGECIEFQVAQGDVRKWVKRTRRFTREWKRETQKAEIGVVF